MIPFPYDPPPLTPDTLEDLLNDVPATLPQALQIGNDLVTADSAFLRNLNSSVAEGLGTGVDGRLTMQYSLAILSAQTVYGLCVHSSTASLHYILFCR